MGEFEFAKGIIYTGEWKNREPHGMGVSEALLGMPLCCLNLTTPDANKEVQTHGKEGLRGKLRVAFA